MPQNMISVKDSTSTVLNGGVEGDIVVTFNHPVDRAVARCVRLLIVAIAHSHNELAYPTETEEADNE